MNKDKKLYILISIVLPLAIVVVWLTWVQGAALITAAICYGLASAIWIGLAIYRAKNISKNKEFGIKKNTKGKWKLIERTISLVILLYGISILVFRLINSWALYSLLAAALLIIVSGSHFLFLWFSTEE